VTTLFYASHEIIIPDNLSEEQRFNYIFSLVQLMKIDERLYQEEIKYCSRISSRLGYSQEVMFELLIHVKATSYNEEQKTLRQLVQKYIKK
jgi:hypothetical protein